MNFTTTTLAWGLGQGLVILLLAGILARFLRQRPRVELRLLWCGVWLALTVAPVVSPFAPKWEWVIPTRADTSDDRTPVTLPVPMTITEPSPAMGMLELVPSADVKPSRSLVSWLLTVWTVGATLLVFRLLASQAVLWRLRRRSTKASSEWHANLLEIADSLGLRRTPRLAQSSRIQVPMTWGWLRPIILLPEQDFVLSAEERRFVLAHECLHIRRHDSFWLTLAHATLCLHWVNPLAWWAIRRLRVAQEQSCDDNIINRQPEDAANYADFLLHTAKRTHNARIFHPLALAMLPKLPSQLKQRLTHILSIDMKRTTNNRNRAGIILLVATTTVLVATLGWRTETQAHEVSDPDLQAKLDATMLETVNFDEALTDNVLEFIKEQLNELKVNMVILPGVQSARSIDLRHMEQQIMMANQEEQTEQARLKMIDVMERYRITETSESNMHSEVTHATNAVLEAETRVMAATIVVQNLSGLDTDDFLRTAGSKLADDPFLETAINAHREELAQMNRLKATHSSDSPD